MVIIGRRAQVLAYLFTALSFPCVAGAGQARLEDDFFNLSLAELGQVQISIATGNSTSVDKAPATASVIYAAEIAAMGAHNLNDVLETLPGFHVSLSSLSRLDAVYSVRGIHTGFNSQVLLLLNGVPVQFSLQGGRPTLLRVPVTNIERIEVIRGPGSAIYGADAFAGVINVITKVAATTEPQLGVGVGSFGGRELWLQTAFNEADWGLALSMSYQESDGDSARIIKSDLQSALDTAFGLNASHAPAALASRYQVLDTHLAFTSQRLQANLWSWVSRDAGVGTGAAQALDPEGRDNGDITMFDSSYQFNELNDPWQNTLRASYLHYELDTAFTLFPAGAILPIDQTGNVNLEAPVGLVQFPAGMKARLSGSANDGQLEFVSQYSGWDRHRLRLAIGYKQQKLVAQERKNYGPGVIDGSEPLVGGELTDVTGTAYVFIPDSQRNLHFFSLQDEWQLRPDLLLTSGIRYDDYSDFGATSNPRLALVWSATDKITSKLLYGSAFRPPSFSEQYFQNNPVSLGNKDLRPEKIDSLEWSLNYRASANLQTTVTLFSYKAKDMIDFIADANATTKTAHNVLDQDGKGVELEVNWKPAENWRLSGNYSWQDARNCKTQSAIADAPQQQMLLAANWEFRAQWSLNSQLNWVAQRARAQGDPRPAIADYTLVNLTLRRKQLVPNLDLSLSLRNLTNADAREPSSISIKDDYPLESRSIWLQMNYFFN